jgi:hypothetical protein
MLADLVRDRIPLPSLRGLLMEQALQGALLSESESTYLLLLVKVGPCLLPSHCNRKPRAIPTTKQLSNLRLKTLLLFNQCHLSRIRSIQFLLQLG